MNFVKIYKNGNDYLASGVNGYWEIGSKSVCKVKMYRGAAVSGNLCNSPRYKTGKTGIKINASK